MPKRSETPLEERRYGHFFLLLAGLLALSTFWAIWDMLRERAPWQRYQMEINSLEYANTEAELTAEQEKFERRYAAKLETLQQQLTEAESKLIGEDYQSITAEVQQVDLKIEKAMQVYRFAKSEYDALWYEYKHAEHTGHTDEMESLRPKIDNLQTEITALKQAWDDAEAEKDAIEEREAGFRQEITQLQEQIAKLNKPMDELETKLGNISDRKIKIEQFVMAGFVKGNFQSYLDQVDRCTSCHVNEDKGGFDEYNIPFKTHPNREVLIKNHPINQFGCSPCHEGQGEAIMLPHAHGFVSHWPKPLLNETMVEAGCNKCHSSELKVEAAPNLTRSKRMMYDLACYACHEVAGYEKMRKIGPELNSITKKTTNEFIYRWVKDTKSFRQHTRMPNPQFTDQEALAVTAYLNFINKESDYSVPRAPYGGSVTRGENYVESLGCKGCHVVTDKDREVRVTDVTYDMAPELTKIGSKVNRDWLYAWIRNPKQYNPNTSMPKLRLTDNEALDIVAYLTTQKEGNPPAANLAGADLDSEELIDEGKTVIRNFGCHGCHEIKGMEKEGKVSVALDEFGGKTHDELFFGDAIANESVPDDSWEAWTIGKMKNSRLYATEAVVQRMPNFEFSDEDALSMTMLLRSWDGRKIGKNFVKKIGTRGESLEKGRRLVRQYNCVGCHIIEDEGGYIRPTVIEAFKAKGKTEDAALSASPPDLIGEGRKVQPDWLFDFLKNPTTNIRPWLDIRMPNFDFNDEEVNTLIAYFQALEDINRPFSEININLTRAEKRAAEKLYSADYLSCFSCHQVGNKKPEGPPEGWAPDFMLAPDRLNPDWVSDWIADPQAMQPGTKMPAFYPDIAEALPDILEGDADKQVEALRDYLMNIRKFANNL